MAASGNMGPPVRRRGIQPLTCSACGSVWFRTATFVPSYPQARLQAPLLVCLCGAAVTPQLSGIRPPADQDEVDQLLGALEIVRNSRQAITDVGVLPDVSAGAALPDQIARLERSCQLILERLLPASPAVKRSRLPRRVAATHGLDAIALELQRAGLLNFRQARLVVRTLRDVWKAALVKGESVETPLGDLLIRKTRSGGRRVVFEPSFDLDFEVEGNRP
jgi:hypothetical protein